MRSPDAAPTSGDELAGGAAPLRVVTAASLFDGHDAAITLIRRLLQDHGAEVVHLGHNRSVADVVRAVTQEDADAVAVSSYQGGHLEYFGYLVSELADRGADHVRVFGGGGGTITHEEIAAMHAAGVERVYHPDDGLQLGLDGMIEDLIARTVAARRCGADAEARQTRQVLPDRSDDLAVGELLSAIEDGVAGVPDVPAVPRDVAGLERASGARAPVIGVTGTGGAGKSSVIDELLVRFLTAFPELRVAVLAVDPSRSRTGGALLGDRIRMNALRSGRVFMRSFATRRRHASLGEMLAECVQAVQAVGFDLVIVETAGIGQADSSVVDLVDVPVYVMTSEFGAATQLEKIDMLDFADLIILNKADRRGSADALRDIRKQWRRNRLAFDVPDEAVPVYPTVASQFNDRGVTAAFNALCAALPGSWEPGTTTGDGQPDGAAVVATIPPERTRYLAEIAAQGRELAERVDRDSRAAELAQSLWRAMECLADPALPALWHPLADDAAPPADATAAGIREQYATALATLSADSLTLLREWPDRAAALASETGRYTVRGREIAVENRRATLSGTLVPRVAAPTYRSAGDLLRYLHAENLPGAFPFTAGVYPYRRGEEHPTRMFAGEGPPERTNRRFHYLRHGSVARLSTAFDSVTLYGEDPSVRPDVYGKVGNSGVSVPTLDDMKRLYSGFDLCAPTTSVSMTINGPAPIILAMFFRTAIDQQVEKYLRAEPGRWDAAQQRISELLEGREQPRYRGELPHGHDGLGLALLGVDGAEVVDPETYARLRSEALAAVRGTVQADILKEDQAQNTCIFGIDFALRMMGDVQQFVADAGVRNFYTVSVSGYHIAEAGANPITQLAFTLANGFTLVEYYLSRGLTIDEVAPHLSFFFSNGMDPEYAVIGRVARRIWARAMRDRYGASPRSQMLKYHIQTSGRSLHAQEVEFNDIRTTLQALYAVLDSCNSLHTNAYDEAVTTPTEESVRRAVAIQLILESEFGLNQCENSLQGSFVVSELTDLVEAAVYAEFDAISERGGVLAAMETAYQRGRIQDESMRYEHRKHDGSLPLIGVNTFLPPDQDQGRTAGAELVRSTSAEKDAQVEAVAQWQQARHGADPGALARLQEVARSGGNVFAELMTTVATHSLGQITGALYEVGGEYRRAM
ncbi:methylmalonyl-CoA mutase family protein [Ruania halotolerans]|uniref:methylmalonyl-CoA mutase family protein n=1 Tax=Ruania halotolerans TaxID=2897773 RepID=UPI001E4E9BC7|nr:methylmalonyl-CoA mutase family protein [Ruania halotolerans]UFU04907.1 methylmalonyl-CoA mutase family protein [Ruania halotolerans]